MERKRSEVGIIENGYNGGLKYLSGDDFFRLELSSFEMAGVCSRAYGVYPASAYSAQKRITRILRMTRIPWCGLADVQVDANPKYSSPLF